MTIRVLVVDDSATIRYTLTEQLRSNDMHVEEARNGGEALDKLAPGHGFHVVISDLKMPAIDGLTLVNTIQRAGQLRNLPILILTSSTADEDHVRNVEAGAAAFMTKPWNEKVLIATVRRLAEQKVRTDSLEEASRTDPLTSLANRRFGVDRLNEEIARSRRSGDGLAVALLDIDHFKRINDTLGHGAGDDVLRQMSDKLREVSRLTDVVVRWGGEEFLFAFPGTALEDAAMIVERFRVHLDVNPIQLTNSEAAALPVTISGGVAELEENDTLESLVERADDALYKAKESGRNRLLMWQLGQLRPVVAAA